MVLLHTWLWCSVSVAHLCESMHGQYYSLKPRSGLLTQEELCQQVYHQEQLQLQRICPECCWAPSYTTSLHHSFLPYVFKNMVTSNTSIRSHSKLHNGGQECSDKMSGRFYGNNFCASTCYLWGNFLVQAYFICHTEFEVCEKYQMNSVLGRDWSMVVCCYLYICFYVRFIFFVSNNTFFSYPSLTQ